MSNTLSDKTNKSIADIANKIMQEQPTKMRDFSDTKPIESDMVQRVMNLKVPNHFVKEDVEQDVLKARQELMKAKGVSTGNPIADRARKVKRLMDTFPMKKEEVEQIDEAVKVGPANHDKSTDTVWHGVHHDGKEIGTIGTNSAQNVAKHGKWGFEDSRGYGRRHGEPEMNSKEEALDALVNRHKEYAKKKANEEVEQIDEVGPQKKATRLHNKLRDAVRGARYKQSGMPVFEPETQHKTPQAHNKAIGRALRAMSETADKSGLSPEQIARRKKMDAEDFKKRREDMNAKRQAGTAPLSTTYKEAALDPVGREDADVNNDGKHGHSTDKYLLKRRAAISTAMAKKGK